MWTQLNEHRREALEVNGGTITGPQFFRTSFVAYFRPDGVRFVDYFPWITLPGQPAEGIAAPSSTSSTAPGSVSGVHAAGCCCSPLASSLMVFRRTDPRASTGR